MFSLFEWKRNHLAFILTVLILILAVSQVQLRIGQMKTRDAQRKAGAELVGRALDRYYQDHEILPLADNGRIVACGDLADVPCVWGQDQIRDVEGVVYLKNLPQDPLFSQGRTYIYEVDAARRHYKIYTVLEYRRDEAWKTDLTTQCGNELQCNWYVKN